MSKIADDVIIVTSSLTKDMTGKEDQYRASAIRALCTITDVGAHVHCILMSYMYTCSCDDHFQLQASMIQAIERYMKQAIVDRNPAVSSAALISSFVSFVRKNKFHCSLLAIVV